MLIKQKIEELQNKFVEEFRKLVESDILDFMKEMDRLENLIIEDLIFGKEDSTTFIEFVVPLEIPLSAILGDNGRLVQTKYGEFSVFYDEDGITLELDTKDFIELSGEFPSLIETCGDFIDEYQTIKEKK